MKDGEHVRASRNLLVEMDGVLTLSPTTADRTAHSNHTTMTKGSV